MFGGVDPTAMGFSFDIPSLIASLIYGIIGLWIFRRAKKMANLKNILVGIALMVYPYFVSGPVKTWGVGAVLCAIAYYYWDD
jgi:glucose uptake protein GlcU